VDNLKPKFLEWAQSKSLDPLQLGRCYDARATEGEINRNVAESKALRVNSTPTMFVNGRMLPGSLPWPQLKLVIDWELNHARKMAAEAEACCTLTLPTPLPAKK
jgi:protein-disulfide isomerase